LNTTTDTKKKNECSGLMKFLCYLLRFLVFTTIGGVLLYMNPFGVDDITEEATQNALYKFMAPFYETNARKDIVVVLVDGNAIENLHSGHKIEANEWPLLYKDHATLLVQIARHSPRAVFVDVYFKKERSTDSTFPNLIRRIQSSKEKYGTDFIFAGGGAGEQLSSIQKTIDKNFGLVVNGWSGYGNNYPLKIASEGSDWTAAMELYDIACLSEKPMLGCSNNVIKKSLVNHGNSMSVRWGNQPAVEAFTEFREDISSCLEQGTGPSMLGDFFAELLKGLVDINEKGVNNCGFHTVLYMDEIVEINGGGTALQKEKLSALLNDKVVIYGVSLEGLHDLIVSPVHGMLPGAMFHAMALDNLMTFGNEFTKGTDAKAVYAGLITWAATVLWLLFVQWWSSESRLSSGQKKDYVALLIFIFFTFFIIACGASSFPLFVVSCFMGVCILGGWLIVPTDDVRYKSYETLDKNLCAKGKGCGVCERCESCDGCKNGKPGKLFFVTFGFAPILACALFGFFCLHYEPVNAVGFSVLAAFSSRVLEEGVIKKWCPRCFEMIVGHKKKLLLPKE